MGGWIEGGGGGGDVRDQHREREMSALIYIMLSWLLGLLVDIKCTF